MMNGKLKINTGLVVIGLITGISGCSTISQVGKSARNLTTFGNKDVAGIDDKLIIPPSLKSPVNTSANNTAKPTRTVQSRPVARQTPRKTVAARPVGNSNYYIIVGTYPDQLEALETFTRISSIGLKGATMESRRTRAGSLLHMVRLGPYKNQDDIDQAKDSLTSTGLSQFKIVEN